MAIPWQTDHNSCSIHQTLISTNGMNESNGAGLGSDLPAPLQSIEQ